MKTNCVIVEYFTLFKCQKISLNTIVSQRGSASLKKGTKWDKHVLHLDAGLAMTAKKPRPQTLCLMVKSLCGKYEDIVAMIPVSSICSSLIKKWFLLVLKLVTELGLDVVAILCDGHSSNRCFFTQELC